MSVLNKVPFINTVLSKMTVNELKDLYKLMNGDSEAVTLSRTMGLPSGTRSRITSSDIGVHMCSLQTEQSLQSGYLLYPEEGEGLCVLIRFTDFQVLGLFKINLVDYAYEIVSEYLDINELRYIVTDLLAEAGEVIHVQVDDIDSGDTPNGKVIVAKDGGAEWATVKTFKEFPSTWDVGHTTKDFCDDVAADEEAVEGMAYLGEVLFTDMPGLLGNAELVVEIKTGDTAATKIITLILTSGNVAPYHWEYTYWNQGSNVSGWIAFQEQLVSGTNIKTINNESVLGSGNISLPVTEFAGVIADAYDATATYAVGDLCVYNNLLYECSTAIATPEAWTAAHWTQTTVQGSILGAINTGV